MYQSLENTMMVVPVSVLSGGKSNDSTKVRIQIGAYLPNEFGQKCYQINAGWTSAVVEAGPIYRYWHNILGYERKLKRLIKLPVVKFYKTKTPGEFSVKLIGSVNSYVVEPATLYIDRDDCPSVMPWMINSVEQHSGIIVAGQLREFTDEFHALPISPSDEILIVTESDVPMDFIRERISVASPFAYNFVEAEEEAPVPKHRYSMEELVARRAEFDIVASSIFTHEGLRNKASAKCRLRAVAYNPKLPMLHAQVVKCEAAPDLEDEVIKLEVDMFYGLYTNLTLASLNAVYRPLITREFFTQVLEAQKSHLESVITKKGYGVYASRHEALGVISDELQELRDAIHGKESDDRVISELQDIATGCLWSIASIRSGAMSW